MRRAFSLLGGQFGVTLTGLLSITVLARLLDPSTFGIMAMAMVAMALGATIRDAGLSSAAIQAASLSPAQRSNLWWANTVIGIILAIVTALLAPLIGLFFESSAVALVLGVLSFDFVLSGMFTQYRASLVREHRYRPLVTVEIMAAALGLLAAILLALAGAGVWALVAQALVSSAFALVAFAWVSGWLPQRYDRSQHMSGLYRFGLPLLGTTLADFAAANIDTVLVGRIAGANVLGVYSRASRLARQPLNAVRAPLGLLALSTLAKAQDDASRLVQLAAKGQLLVAYPLLLASGLIAVYSDLVVAIFLGPGWGQAIVFLSLVALGEGLSSLSLPGRWLFTSTGKTRSLLHYTLFSSGVRIIFTVGFMVWLGPLGAAVSIAVAPILLWPISIVWVGRSASLKTRVVLADGYRIFAVCACVTLVLWWAREWMHMGIVAEVGVGAVLMGLTLAVLAVIPQVRHDYVFVLSTLIEGMRRRA